MTNDMDRLHNKVDKLDEKLDAIDTHLAVYNEQLKIHIKRTELLEADVAPIKEHVIQLNSAIKVVTYIIGISGTIAAITKYFEII